MRAALRARPTRRGWGDVRLFRAVVIGALVIAAVWMSAPWAATRSAASATSEVARVDAPLVTPTAASTARIVARVIPTARIWLAVALLIALVAGTSANGITVRRAARLWDHRTGALRWASARRRGPPSPRLLAAS